MGNRWYIHIIESPGEDDLRVGRCEGKVLSEMLRLIGVEFDYRMVRTMQDWENALTEFTSHVKEKNRTPLLHISIHGSKDEDGLILTDGSMITPDELGNQFRRVKTRLGGRLVTCLSACSGFFPAAYACRGDVPFGMLFAPVKTVRWDEAALWYCVFYYRLYHELDPTKAGMAANAAIGNDELFSCFTEDAIAEVIRRRDALGRIRDSHPV
jgi:hypothetical protein